MERVVEDDDSLAAGRGARDLDGVLDRLRARVDEHRALLPGSARRELREAAAHLHVRLVRPHDGALVQVAVGLVLDRLDDRGVAVAGVLAADTACEIDVGLPVDVRDTCPFRARYDEPRGRDTRGDVPCALLGRLLRRGALLQGHRPIIGSAACRGKSQRLDGDRVLCG